jgi:cytochrome c oxidase subunit 3
MTAAGIAHDRSPSDRAYNEIRYTRLLGFLAFIMTDMVLFSSFIFAYLYLRNTAQPWAPAGVPHLEVSFAALNSVVLFGSGTTMHYALENWKHRRFNRYAFSMLSTIVLGTLFVLNQAYEYTKLVYHEHVTWGGSGIFGTSFYTLTGMHGIHVTIGVVFLSILFLQSVHGKYTKSRYFGLTGGYALLAFRRHHLDRALYDLLSHLRLAVNLHVLESVIAITGCFIVAGTALVALKSDWNAVGLDNRVFKVMLALLFVGAVVALLAAAGVLGNVPKAS